MRLVAGLLLLCFCSWGVAQDVHNHDHSIYHAFIENKGQWKEDVYFMTKFNGGNLWVEKGRFFYHFQDFSEYQASHAALNKKVIPESLTYQQHALYTELIGVNLSNDVIKKEPTAHYYNYFIGNDQSKWVNDVRGYHSITVANIYDQIDLHFIEKHEELKYEYIVHSNADASVIRWKYHHHDKLQLKKNGDLLITTPLGALIEQKPYAYQIINGKIIEIPCVYSLEEEFVTFQIGNYDKDYTLVIDPTLVFSTFCGAISDNFGMTATYGYDGSAYNAGMVYGNNYPMPDPNAFDVSSNLTLPNVGVVTTDAFISKYSADGTTMLWSTFFGGGDNTQGTEVPHSLICDEDDNVYVYGVTSALDFPIVNGVQPNHAGGTPLSINFNGTNFGNVGTDIFVAKFSANGHNLLGSTYVGGSGNDGVNYMISAGNYNNVQAYDSLSLNYGDQFRGEIMLDAARNVIVASCTRSIDFPTQQPFQAANGGQQDGVVFKLSSDFSSYIFSSYYGGAENDACYSVKLDENENVIFAGGTCSPNLPAAAGGFWDSYQGGIADGFIAKADPSGQNLLQTTYVGMSDYDQIFFVEVDRENEIYVVGQSRGGNFPVSPGAYNNPGSSQFLAHFSTDLTQMLGSTVFGSGSPNIDISPAAFLVDICGNLYVSGWGANILQATPIGAMPVTPNAFQSTAPNGFDFYLIVIEREFGGLLYGTFMGGPLANEHVDGGTSRFDKNGVVYQAVCAGCGGHSDFPTTPGAWSANNLASNCNSLVFKFDFNLIPVAEFLVDNNIGCAPFEVTFENNSSQSDGYIWDFGDGNLDSTTFEPTIIYTVPGIYEVFLYVTDSICLITDTAMITITVTPELILDSIPPIEQCEPGVISLEANSFGTATQFVWSSNAQLSDTLNTSISDSTLNQFIADEGYLYIQLSNPGCEKLDSVWVGFTSAALSLSGDSTICLGETATILAESVDDGITFSNFQWSPAGIIQSGQGTEEVTVLPNGTQFIVVTAEASNGCIVTDSILVQVSDIDATLVSATASETDVPQGSIVTLTAQPSGYTYTWLPAANLTEPNSQITDALVNETTTFIVIISDGICDRAAQVEVRTFEFICDEPFIFVPNAFTPNGDGNNDILFAKTTLLDETQAFIFRIFNRWGEKVFETNDIGTGWDGTWRGKLSDPDVYDYYLEGFCIDGQNFLIQGNVTLIR